MPSLKNHHFVPQFYLRNFSRDRKSIDLYNINSNRIIEGASIRDQCSKDYFYGKDNTLENYFGNIESKFANIIKTIINNKTFKILNTIDKINICSYIVIQNSRTIYSINQTNDMADKLLKTILKTKLKYEKDYKGLKHLDKVKIHPVNSIFLSIENSIDKYWTIYDLKMALLYNNTNNAFITSDHPVALYNKFYENIKDIGVTGLQSSGLIIVLPLNSNYVLFMYDRKSYSVGHNELINISNKEDVDNINKLQIARAYQNLYFNSSNVNKERVYECYHKYKKYRKAELTKITEHGREDFSKGGKTLVVSQPANYNVQLDLKFLKMLRKAVKKRTRRFYQTEISMYEFLRNPKLASLYEKYRKTKKDTDLDIEFHEYMHEILKNYSNS